MELFLIWILLVFVVGAWAERWNRSALVWFLVSLFLSPAVGGVALFAVGNNSRKCPHCLGHVPEAAVACRNCGRDLHQGFTKMEDTGKIAPGASTGPGSERTTPSSFQPPYEGPGSEPNNKLRPEDIYPFGGV